MLSKRTKICVSLLSLSILAFLITAGLAANYHNEHAIVAKDNGVQQFKVTANLDVTTTIGSEGYKISSYDTYYEFDTTYSWYLWWIFWQWLPDYEFVNVQEDTTLQRLWNGDIITVRYEVSGKVWKRTDHSKYVMVEVWVKTWADGNTDEDASYWDDQFGFDYYV